MNIKKVILKKKKNIYFLKTPINGLETRYGSGTGTGTVTVTVTVTCQKSEPEP
jgi:hypothetical protein